MREDDHIVISPYLYNCIIKCLCCKANKKEWLGNVVCDMYREDVCYERIKDNAVIISRMTGNVFYFTT